MDDDEKLQRELEITACRGKATVMGTGIGALVGAAGTRSAAGTLIVGIAGAALGFLWGARNCGQLSAALADRVSSGAPLSESDARIAAAALARHAGLSSPVDGFRLLVAVQGSGAAPEHVAFGMSPAQAASQLLSTA